jgi:Cu2+-exporting ATPase
VARSYAPAVHLAALLTFLGWYGLGGVTANEALLTASAVLIITCPCALALAVPAVQVIATSRLFRGGILLKNPTALERLAEVDAVVFDKTGTLTEPSLALVDDQVEPEALAVAASLAASSRHPLARALVAAAGQVAAHLDVVEHPGQGLAAGAIRLGSARFCGVNATDSRGPALWLVRPDHAPVRFVFEEHPRADAARVVGQLVEQGLAVQLLSGDTIAAVGRIAGLVGIGSWQAGLSPVEKVTRIEALGQAGHRVLMVGDGLNDGPSLAAAHVSASPSTAADITQTVADAVFQGQALRPILTLLTAARKARRIMRGNIALAIGYNVLMVPLAVAGLVTPWVAAAAMSSSSVLVIANSFRAGRID